MALHRTIATSVILGSALLTQGCYTTRVIPGSDDPKVRFAGPDGDERIVRRESWSNEQHHLIFGLLPRPAEWRVSDVVTLGEDESLVNTRIVTEMTPTNVLVQLGAAVLSQGVSLLLWQMTTVRIEGDVVVQNQAEPVRPETKASTGTSVEGSNISQPTPQAPRNSAATPAAPGWRVISGSRSHESATSACEKLGMRLPTREELKTQRGTLAKGGEFWTSDGEKDFEDEFWFVDMASGASFLKSSDVRLSVACVSGRVD